MTINPHQYISDMQPVFSEYFPLDGRSMPGDEGNSSMLAVSGILRASLQAEYKLARSLVGTDKFLKTFHDTAPNNLCTHNAISTCMHVAQPKKHICPQINTTGM